MICISFGPRGSAKAKDVRIVSITIDVFVKSCIVGCRFLELILDVVNQWISTLFIFEFSMLILGGAMSIEILVWGHCDAGLRLIT